MFRLCLSLVLVLALLLPLPAPAQEKITGDADFSDVTAVLPTITMTILLPERKRPLL